jgi:phosphate transport system protein
MERAFDEHLSELKHMLVKMSALAELMLEDAVRVLVDRDEKSADSVYKNEEKVNRMQVEVDEKCLDLIARHQPMASDLRFIMGCAKTNSDLERLADQAVNICQNAQRLLKEPPLKEYEIIPRMAVVAREMLDASLHAFIANDAEKARAVLKRDDEVDGLKTKITDELIDFIVKDPSIVRRAMTLLLVARNLERIGDHATNIAENAIFVKEGRDIRHHMNT